MSVDKINGVISSTISKINWVLLPTISSINGVLVSVGGWELYNASFNVEYFDIGARENTSKHIYFKPDGTRFYSVGEDSWTSGTNGYLTGGSSAQSNYTTWEAVTDGSFRVYIDGARFDIVGIDFTDVTDMDDVAGVIQTAIRNATGRLETCVWSTDHFVITSVLNDADSSISVLSTMDYGDAGTDISGAGASDWMDCDTGNGTPTQGTSTRGGHILIEYTLSTPWDVTSMRYSNSYAIESNTPYANDIKGLIFSADGYKIFIANAWEGTSNPDHYYSYTMSVAWDLSTISYDNKSYDFSSDGINCHGLAIKADGTKLWACDYGEDGDSTGLTHIVQYTFGTAWDLSTLSKDVAELDTSSEIYRMNSFYMNADGTRIFAVSKYIDSSHGDNAVYQYNLSTPYDLSSGSYASKTYALDRVTTGIFVRADGYRMILLDVYNDWTRNYALGTSWELSNVFWANNVYLYESSASSVSFIFVDNGTKIWDIRYNGTVGEFVLSAAYDIRTAKYNDVSYDFSGTESACRDIQINSDGTKLYVLGSNTDKVHEINLSTPYDLSTASYSSAYFSVSYKTGTYPMGLHFSSDGSKMYVCNQDGICYQWGLSTPWDVTTAVYSDKYYDTDDQMLGRCRGMTMSDDGSKLYVSDYYNNKYLYQYDMSTPWDISTCSYIYSFSCIDASKDLSITPYGFRFKPGGKRIFISDGDRRYWQVNIN